MRLRGLALTGLVAATLVSLRVAGQGKPERQRVAPMPDVASWPTSPDLPWAHLDKSASRERRDASALALLSGYRPPGGLAIESYDPDRSGPMPPPSAGAMTVRIGAVTVEGALDVVIVHRIVRTRFGRMRACYERAASPWLAGQVTARFAIGKHGESLQVINGGSDLPDSRVVRCVLDVLKGLEFPPPDHGVAIVRVPVIFNPG